MGLVFFTLLSLFIQVGTSPAAQLEKKGTIQGDDFVNLRAGPGKEHPSRAVLKRGDEIVVKAEERGWYLVSLPDQTTGYVSRELVYVADSSGIPEVSKKRMASEVHEETQEVAETLPRQQESSPAIEPDYRPVVQVIDGNKWEILRWLLAAICIFIIGWILGGNYYLRRDRINRTKLRF